MHFSSFSGLLLVTVYLSIPSPLVISPTYRPSFTSAILYTDITSALCLQTWLSEQHYVTSLMAVSDDFVRSVQFMTIRMTWLGWKCVFQANSEVTSLLVSALRPPSCCHHRNTSCTGDFPYSWRHVLNEWMTCSCSASASPARRRRWRGWVNTWIFIDPKQIGGTGLRYVEQIGVPVSKTECVTQNGSHYFVPPPRMTTHWWRCIITYSNLFLTDTFHGVMSDVHLSVWITMERRNPWSHYILQYLKI